jgi:[ribosomal protein S5]-alanine N-acetyltransferase
MMRETFAADRLTLRRMARTDADRLVALCGDIRVAGKLSRMPHPYLPEHAEEWLGRQDRMWTENTDRVWAIDVAGEGLIGGIGLHFNDRMSLDGTPAWELGYWLGVPYWGRGYATEAGKAVLAELERALGPTPVNAGYATENAPSGHVLAKLGFQKTGVIRDLPNLALGVDSPTVVVARPAAVPYGSPP